MRTVAFLVDGRVDCQLKGDDMTFSSVARFVATSMIGVGLILTALSFYVNLNPEIGAELELIGPAGNAIVESLMVVIGGVALGVLTDISRAVSTKDK